MEKEKKALINVKQNNYINDSKKSSFTQSNQASKQHSINSSFSSKSDAKHKLNSSHLQQLQDDSKAPINNENNNSNYMNSLNLNNNTVNKSANISINKINLNKSNNPATNNLIIKKSNNALNKQEENKEAKEFFEMELKIAFDLFDEDNSGNIDKDEFGNVMKKLGLNPTKVEIQEMLDIMDKENIGQIDFESFKKIMTKSINDDFLIDSSIEAFSLFDKNKNGKLEKKQLVNILIEMCYMEREEAESLITDEYFDENNEVDYVKFVRDTFDMLNY